MVNCFLWVAQWTYLKQIPYASWPWLYLLRYSENLQANIPQSLPFICWGMSCNECVDETFVESEVFTGWNYELRTPSSVLSPTHPSRALTPSSPCAPHWDTSKERWDTCIYMDIENAQSVLSKLKTRANPKLIKPNLLLFPPIES